MRGVLRVLLLCVVVCFDISQSRTIQWTSAGGNPLWNNAGNWDCQCLPTADDDVVINLEAIPGTVEASGVPSLCRSLNIGGSSPFPQTLKVYGALRIGEGGGSLSKNGVLLVKTNPEAPLSNQGPFTVEGKGFSFYSGTIDGAGTFTFASDTIINFTSSAMKTISSKVESQGSISSQSSDSSGTFITLSSGGSLTLAGSFEALSSISLSIDPAATFRINNLDFSGQSFFLQGSANIEYWNITKPYAQVSVNNDLVTQRVTLARGATLSFVGHKTTTRTIDTIDGKGDVVVRSGTATFSTLDCNSLVSGGGSVSITSSFQAKSLTVDASSLLIAEGQSDKVLITTGTLSVKGQLLANNFTYVGGNLVGTTNSSSMVTTNLILTSPAHDFTSLNFTTEYMILDCLNSTCLLATTKVDLNATGPPPPPPPVTTTTSSSTTTSTTTSSTTSSTTTATTSGPITTASSSSSSTTGSSSTTSGPTTTTGPVTTTTSSSTTSGPSPPLSASAFQQFAFPPSAPAPVARAGAVAGLTANGNTFVVLGGEEKGSSWSYDFVHNAWSPLGGAELPITGACGAVTPDGQFIYIYGGKNTTGHSSTSLYQFSFNTGKIVALPTQDATHPSTGVACSVVGGKFYLFGGECSQQVSVLALADNPLTWKPVKLNSDNNPSTDGASVVLSSDGESVYMWGGSCANHSDAATMWKLDLVRDAWMIQPTNGNSPPPRAYQSVGYDVISQQEIIIFGGESTVKDEVYNDLWVYNTGLLQWTELTPSSATGAPPARAKANSVYAHGRLLFFSGNGKKYEQDLIHDFWEVVVRESCFAWSTCDDCSIRDGCGWCESNQPGYQCISGNSQGPYISGDCKQSLFTTQAMCVKPFPTWAIAVSVVGGVIVLAGFVWYLMKRAGKKHDYQSLSNSASSRTSLDGIN